MHFSLDEEAEAQRGSAQDAELKLKPRPESLKLPQPSSFPALHGPTV